MKLRFFFYLIAHIRESKSKMLHRSWKTAYNPEMERVSTPQVSLSFPTRTIL